MTGSRPTRLMGWAAAWILLCAIPAGSQEPLSAGERLYRFGRSAAGRSIPALVQGDLRVRSIDMPCANCHRRSGWGTSEGTLTVPALVGRVLFEPVTRGAPEMGPRRTGPGTRPAYTEEALLRAVRDGIDPGGRRLSASMPRYEIDRADAAALAEHFRTLSADPEGVTPATLHLATVLAPDVDPAQRSAVLEVLRAYVRTRNAGTRHEARRRERGPWDMRQQYEVYRTWVLHEWELQGDAAGWTSQLEALYERQPVFALLSGLAGDWSPIRAFSERYRLPVVLPQTPLPALEGSDSFYALHFSGGVTADAEKLAHHFTKEPLPRRRVLQISRCKSPGQAAAAAFERAAAAGPDARSVCLEDTAGLTSSTWRSLLNGKANTLVLWFDHRDRRGLETLAESTEVLARLEGVFVSSRLLGEAALRLPPPLARRVSLVHPYAAPADFDRHAWRTLAWLKASGVTPADRWAAANAFFAATIAGDALGMPRTLASRELFIERIEHMAAVSPHRSAYPAVSFDPIHHVASAAFSIASTAGTSPNGGKADP